MYRKTKTGSLLMMAIIFLSSPDFSFSQSPVVVIPLGEEIECGNGILDDGEECELGTMEGATCTSLGFQDGTLGCAPGSCTFETSGCNPILCDPLNPVAVCGSNSQCTPLPTGDPICNSPIGLGTQGVPCSTDADCDSTYACIDATTLQCLQRCRIGLADCSSGTCTSLSPQLFVGSQEYGVCI